MKEFVPIILLASERSGTNLLRALVSSHSAVASPPPCSIVDVLANYQFQYFPPSQPPRIRELVEDAITLTQSHLNPWDMDLTPEMVMERMNQASFWDVFRVINELYSEKSGKSFWFTKEPALLKHIFEIRAHMPSAKYIYLVRDGRDVASSILKGGLQEFHVFDAANRWVHDQKICLCAITDPLLKERIHMLKYEDLLEDPESVMRRTMDFVGLEYETSQLEYYKRKNIIDHSEKSRYWKNLSKPIDSSNKGRYRTNLNTRQIKIFESVAGKEMEYLGYSLDNEKRKRISAGDRAMFWIIAHIKMLLKRIDRNQERARIRARTKIFLNIQNRNYLRG